VFSSPPASWLVLSHRPCYASSSRIAGSKIHVVIRAEPTPYTLEDERAEALVLMGPV